MEERALLLRIHYTLERPGKTLEYTYADVNMTRFLPPLVFLSLKLGSKPRALRMLGSIPSPLKKNSFSGGDFCI
jgi:hypothetical protein